MLPRCLAPPRALLVGLVSLLLLTVPMGARAVGARTSARPSHSHGFTRAQARQVLHRAQSLLGAGARSRSARPKRVDVSMTLRDLYLAKSALAGSERRSADRLLSRRTPAARMTASAAAATPLCSEHFCIHYAAPTKRSWAQTTDNVMEHVWAVEVPMMGKAPLSDGGSAHPTADNPNDKLDVFLEDLGDQGLYGYCSSDDETNATQVSAYCALDDDFARSQYGARPVNSLHVTAAHEFNHAIQYAYDVTEDVWFMEGTATWAEDYVYDSINDNYQYLPTSPITHPRTALDYSGGLYPYGSFIFFTYSSERRGVGIIRRYWEEAVGQRTSLQAIYAVVGEAPEWPTWFTTFASWNTLPLHSYSERAGYPRPAWSVRPTLSAHASTTGLHSVTLSHLGSSAMLVAPAKNLAPGKRLRIDVDGPPRTEGTAALLQRRYKDGRVTHTMMSVGANGNATALVRFDRNELSSIAVVVANTERTGPSRVFRVRAFLR